ncbi:MAG TPA: FtsX-like permease family protein, partial [Syntrophorhabdaceae bacterium]|nr:FtsX-like permease family protein [Syntrophorhabdaceae bacterium]
YIGLKDFPGELLRAFQRRISGNENISLIQVSVEDGASTQKAQDDIESLLRERRRISSLKPNDFQIRDMKELASTMLATTELLTTLLGAVAAVSLLVGGIGIMNIMLVSVTERTREIGTRLAIGALEREVLLQFLVEAMVLSAFGGLFGIILALIGSAVLVRVLDVPFVIDGWIIFIAFVFSAAVGLIFGYFPARKAASLDPIEALRHE